MVEMELRIYSHQTTACVIENKESENAAIS